MKFTINNNLRLLTGSLLLAGADVYKRQVTASPTERAVLPTLSPISPAARMAELIKIFYLLAFPTLFLQRKDSGVSTFFENSKILIY